MTLLDSYVLLEKIHEGSDVLLYRGQQKSNHASVVIKLPRSEYPTARALLTLRHEYALIRGLPSEGVIKAIGLESHGHGLALVMEDMGGVPMSDAIRSPKLDFATKVRLALALTDAVAHVHDHGVIHKDIKPGNVLINLTTGRVALIDFGLATYLSQETNHDVRPGSIEGTLAYIAPEQTGRMNRSVDARADLYSLGVTMYELFTGALPFLATEPLDLVHSHIARPPIDPREVMPSLPRQIAAIVLKLLAKDPEERYQSALGLKADLELCLRQWAAAAAIDPFVLGEHDYNAELRIPQKLYGRDAEVASLVGTFERVPQGRASLLLVSGYSGIGKSALVHELHKPIARRGGFFISGKFDQFDRSVPFAPITHALRELMKMLLTERDEILARWRDELRDALGANAGVLTPLVPELELVIGAQPPVPELGPAEAQNRFGLVFQSFFRVFTTGNRPLVLFLDDLQWADLASQKLLQILMTDPQRGHLLVVGAYRDNEVTASHPLVGALHELEAAGVTISRVILGPLGQADVTALVADTLHCSLDDAAPLARFVLEKTQGNPFFLTQFLRSLSRDGVIRFESSARAWRWDLDAVASAVATDNVVEFMAQKLARFAPATRRALAVAACLGDRFQLNTLASIDGLPAADTASSLWEVLQEGLIIPQDTGYRFFHGAAQGQEPLDSSMGEFDVSYKFVHDRVRQAADHTLSDEERAAIHLKIGRYLKPDADDRGAETNLFDRVRHLNAGAFLIEDAVERRALAALNLRAGQKAKAATAHQAARDFLEAGVALLSLGSWEEHYSLTYELHVESFECEYLCRNYERADSLYAQLLSCTSEVLDRARVYNLRMVLESTQARFLDALRVGRDSLAVLGAPLPDDRARIAQSVGEELAAVEALLADRAIESIVDAPRLDNPHVEATLRTLLNISMPAHFTGDLELYALVTAKQVRLTLEHGLSSVADSAFVALGLLTAAQRQYRRAYQFGKLAVAINERLNNKPQAARVYFFFSVYAHYVEPLRQIQQNLLNPYRTGLEIGDVTHSGYATSMLLAAQLAIGEPLADVRRRVEKYLAFVRTHRDGLTTATLVGIEQTVANLEGRTKSRHTLDTETFDEAGYLRDALGERFLPTPVPFWYFVQRAELFYLYGDYARALEFAQTAEKFAAADVGTVMATERAYYECLALTASLRGAMDESARAAFHTRLRQVHGQLAIWTELGPDGHAHKHGLIEAEMAALDDDELRALRLYDQAIAASKESGFVRDEALANELAGRFHLSHGRTTIGRAYVTEAHYAYERWGAAAKVAELEESHPMFMLGVRVEAPVPTKTGSHRSTTSTLIGGSNKLDVGTVIQASKALASELVLDKVLDRLMRLVLANAGAQRAFLLLTRDDQLWIEAQVTVDPDLVSVGLGQPLRESRDLSVGIVQYVARSREPVVLTDAATADRFASDAYVSAQKPRSVLCLALTHQSQLTGVLYLEHNGVEGAFTPERIALLEVLASQAAIAVENARLYAKVRAASETLQRANASLEQQVAERTAELRSTLAELWSEMDLAKKIQMVLLPARPVVEGYEVAATMRPADSVGGDYYDVFRAGGKDWVLIGDVSGHGVSAGLIMMMVQTAVRSTVQSLVRARQDVSPSRVLTLVNAAIRSNLARIGEGQYVTITALCVDGSNVTHAGLHQDLVVSRAATRAIEVIESQSVWLGVLDDVQDLLVDQTFELAPGDSVLLYTDGLTEAKVDGLMPGGDAVAKSFHRCMLENRSLPETVDYLLEPVRGSVLRDDVTVMLLRSLSTDAG